MNTSESTNEEHTLAEFHQSLTRINATAMVVGSIIGAAIFVQPSEIARHLTTPEQVMFVWLACGILTLCGAMVCAELASAFPQTGGLYVFLRDTFSPLAGFLWGWAMFWTMHSGIVAAIATVFSRYAAYLLRDVVAADTKILAVGIIVALSAVNYRGARAGSRLQTWLTAAKLAVIAVARCRRPSARRHFAGARGHEQQPGQHQRSSPRDGCRVSSPTAGGTS